MGIPSVNQNLSALSKARSSMPCTKTRKRSSDGLFRRHSLVEQIPPVLLFHMAQRDGQIDPLLAAVMVVDGGHFDPGLGADVPNGGPAGPPLREHLRAPCKSLVLVGSLRAIVTPCYAAKLRAPQPTVWRKAGNMPGSSCLPTSSSRMQATAACTLQADL